MLSPSSPFVIYSSQSATTDYYECPYRRYLGNHYKNTGISPTWSSIPLVTGGCVHEGVRAIVDQYTRNPNIPDSQIISNACQVARLEYQTIVDKSPLANAGKFTSQQEFTLSEQMALVEALLRLWYMYEWPKIKQYYWVLGIEQEILIDLYNTSSTTEGVKYQSRPDLILMDKRSGDILSYSLKTMNSWYDRSEKAQRSNLQCSTEPYATNIWLRNVKSYLENIKESQRKLVKEVGLNYLSKKLETIDNFLQSINLNDTTSAIRFCFLIKGKRAEEEKGVGDYSTNSPLIYGYRKYTPTDIEYAASFWTLNPENKSGYGRLGKGWEKFSIWNCGEIIGGIQGWLNALATGELQTTTGVAKIQNCLDIEHPGITIAERQIISIPDVNVNHNLIRDKVEGEVRETEMFIYEGLEKIQQVEQQKTLDPEIKVKAIRQLQEKYFRKQTNSCHFPHECDFLTICNHLGNDNYKQHIADDPLNEEFGPMFEKRVPHHKPEEEYFKSKGWIK